MALDYPVQLSHSGGKDHVYDAFFQLKNGHMQVLLDHVNDAFLK